jgi:hypothetical protein
MAWSGLTTEMMTDRTSEESTGAPAPNGMTPRDNEKVGCGFAAGTLVHTEMGLVPIEQIRIGDRVWSRPEGDGGAAPAWRQVVKVWACGEQEALLIRSYRAPSTELLAFCAMSGQRFQNHRGGWIDAGELEWGSELTVLEGADATLVCAVPIYRTPAPMVGWAEGTTGCRRNDGAGVLVDLHDTRAIGVGTDEDWNVDCWGDGGRGVRFRMPVFALEVEEFHTYYVSAHEIWAHDGTGTA